MKHLLTAAVAFICTSAFAEEPTLAQRIALGTMYEIESVLARCPFAINLDKVDRDLSKIGMSIADYCPAGRFSEYASPSLNETLSGMMKRLGDHPARMCAAAYRLYGEAGSEHKGWLKKSESGGVSMLPLCTLDRE